MEDCSADRVVSYVGGRVESGSEVYFSNYHLLPLELRCTAYDVVYICKKIMTLKHAEFQYTMFKLFNLIY